MSNKKIPYVPKERLFMSIKDYAKMNTMDERKYLIVKHICMRMEEFKKQLIDEIKAML